MTWAAPRRPSRREVLLGGGLLAVSGCLPSGGRAPADPNAVERRLRSRVAQEVTELSARYDAVLERFPDAAAELATLAAEHDAHVVALLGPRPAGTASSPTSSSTPRRASVPATLAGARTELAAAERGASARRLRQTVGAPAGTARLLASIAACESAHAALLERST